MVFELFAKRTMFGRRWYFRGKARNGEAVLQSEGYRNKSDAMATIELIRYAAPAAQVVEL